VTEEPRQYTLQLRYDGGVYALGLKQIEPRQTQAIDIRALRDRQVPDERGHTLPPDAASGQVNWSMRGGQNQVLIGRSEQADIARGTSSNYACQNCCPDSFAGGWLDPGSVSGVIGDWNQFAALEQTRNCYGSYGAPYYMYPSWDSSDWDVSAMSGAWANDLGNGEARVQGYWTAYEWGSFESGNPDECYPRERSILAEALNAVFGLPRVTSINQEIINESSQGSEVIECGQFRVISTFQVGCPFGPGQGHTYVLKGHIEDDAVELSSATEETANDQETCTYRNVKVYRMKNRLSNQSARASRATRGW
jgi:hypothetical protein